MKNQQINDATVLSDIKSTLMAAFNLAGLTVSDIRDRLESTKHQSHDSLIDESGFSMTVRNAAGKSIDISVSKKDYWYDEGRESTVVLGGLSSKDGSVKEFGNVISTGDSSGIKTHQPQAFTQKIIRYMA
jgi:hypothetical protein